MSQIICKKCIFELNSADRFRCQILDADEYFSFAYTKNTENKALVICDQENKDYEEPFPVDKILNKNIEGKNTSNLAKTSLIKNSPDQPKYADKTFTKVEASDGKLKAHPNDDNTVIFNKKQYPKDILEEDQPKKPLPVRKPKRKRTRSIKVRESHEPKALRLKRNNYSGLRGKYSRTLIRTTQRNRISDNQIKTEAKTSKDKPAPVLKCNRKITNKLLESDEPEALRILKTILNLQIKKNEKGSFPEILVKIMTF